MFIVCISQYILRQQGAKLLEIFEKFEPTKHICKFGFELYDNATGNPLKYNIVCDLYCKELIFEFISKRTGETKEVIGFKLSEGTINSLLPMILWNEFEKYRDLPIGWDFANDDFRGYRDGWGYKFWCLSECGSSLFQVDMNCIYKSFPRIKTSWTPLI